MANVVLNELSVIFYYLLTPARFFYTCLFYRYIGHGLFSVLRSFTCDRSVLYSTQQTRKPIKAIKRPNESVAMMINMPPGQRMSTVRLKSPSRKERLTN